MNKWRSFIDFIPGEYAYMYTTEPWESVCNKYGLNHESPNSFVSPPPPFSLSGPADEQLKEFGRLIISRREQWIIQSLKGIVPNDILEQSGASYKKQSELHKVLESKGYFVRYWKEGKMELMKGDSVISTLPKIVFHFTEEMA